jgi:hypothetical protein
MELHCGWNGLTALERRGASRGISIHWVLPPKQVKKNKEAESFRG